MMRRLYTYALLLLLLAACSPVQERKTTDVDTTKQVELVVAPKPEPEPEPAKRTYPNDFVSLNDHIPDVVLEIRYYTSNNFTGRPVPGYLAPLALLSRPAADSLAVVADELRAKGYRLKIYDAYRPRKAVDAFVRWAADVEDTLMRQQYYPSVDKSQMLGRYISRRSAHARGAAVDLTLVDAATGRDLDMGGTFDWFGEESRPSYCGDPERMVYKPREGGLTGQQFMNRMLLRSAMTAHGFRAITSEWWHFSLRNEPFPHTFFDFDIE